MSGRKARAAAAVLVWAVLVSAARAEAPLSAIDWLSQSVATPATPPAPQPDEAQVATGALPQEVAVSSLDAPGPDSIGLLPPQVTGLPAALWGLGRTDEIAALIASERTDTLPALKALLTAILLAEAEAPADAAGGGTLLLARIDKLLDLGALDPAAALLEKAGSVQPDLFRRTFDVALLTGTEDRACETMRAHPELAPTFPARIFCLARSGDWNAAALTLRTAQTLGFVSDEEDALLSRFLDPELYEDEPPLPKPARPTPLVWRMLEAVGEPLPTHSLPLAFAHAELRDTAGWKAQLDAAERLARAGAIDPGLLRVLYTDRRPAASGGVWDRVAGVQELEAALAAADPASVGALLPGLWAGMAEAELEVPFATLYADPLAALPLTGDAAALAFRIGLLSPSFQQVARARVAADPVEAFLIALALGSVEGLVPPDSMARAIAPSYQNPPPDPEFAALLAEGRLGEALLRAIDRIDSGLRGTPGGVTEGLALLAQTGMTDALRHTALELMLLERRG
jgi:DNA-binding transcriptional regulator YdaS (Cro superfamily)